MTELEKEILKNVNNMNGSQLAEIYKYLNRDPTPGPSNLQEFMNAMRDKQAAESGQPTTSEAKDYFN